MSPELSKLKLGHPSHAAEIFAWLPVTAHFEQEKQNKIKILKYYSGGSFIMKLGIQYSKAHLNLKAIPIN